GRQRLVAGQELGVELDGVDRVLEVVDQEAHEALLLELEPEQIIALAPDGLDVDAELAVEAAELELALDPDDELGGADRLGDEVVAAGGDRLVEGVDVAQGGDEDDRGLAPSGDGAQPAAGLEAVDPGHADVEED